MKRQIIVAAFLSSCLLCASHAMAESARDQLNTVGGQSQNATHQTTQEGARSVSGSGVDTKAPSNPPANIGNGTKPDLLRNADGTNPYSPYEGHAIRTTPPPKP